MAYSKKFKDKLNKMREKRPASEAKAKFLEERRKMRSEHFRTVNEIANMDPIEAEQYIKNKQKAALEKPRAKRELIGNMIGMKLQSLKSG